MFDPNPNFAHLFGYFSHSRVPNGHARLVSHAACLFNESITRGRFARIKRMITRSSGRLLSLEDFHGGQTRAQYFGGLRPVALKNIRGSLGRTTDFDCDFNPLDIRLRDRWQSIAMAFLHHIGLEPVNLIQVGKYYFVQDGHHRISVAQALGQYAIDAEITIWETPQSQEIRHTAGTQIRVAQTIS